MSGCAFGTRKPVLSYTPITPRNPANGVSVHILPFRDQRFDKDIVGYMRNAYGMRTAKVVTETNISDWVTNALKAELANAGYTVLDSKPESATIEGQVLHVFCDAYLMYEGKVEVELTLRRGSDVLLQEKYRGTTQELNVAGTSRSYALVLQKSLQNALRDAIRDIDNQLSHL
jgi:hypothetical protein